MLVSVAGDGGSVHSGSVSGSASWLSTGLLALWYADGGRPTPDDALKTVGRDEHILQLLKKLSRPNIKASVFPCSAQLFDASSTRWTTVSANGDTSRFKVV